MAFIALDEDAGHMLGLVRLKDELDVPVPPSLTLNGHAANRFLDGAWDRIGQRLNYSKACNQLASC